MFYSTTCGNRGNKLFQGASGAADFVGGNASCGWRTIYFFPLSRFFFSTMYDETYVVYVRVVENLAADRWPIPRNISRLAAPSHLKRLPSPPDIISTALGQLISPSHLLLLTYTVSLVHGMTIKYNHKETPETASCLKIAKGIEVVTSK